ncbi:MAG: hypothetical protein COX80_02695 [Candidatus Magasanikbacteria bacterium CG_4_10_14_0_2_um_filter_33_14]|uniref:Uncharacterized protein n=1 Tax=Candidatus Magasanikbacteria bacterium CG_4_10_14_0_2_um_filter_33_14 TaxID=1974636 RepID=A0A2M7VAP5_9BACT|nr:MAG: hypothetical protein COX80_02695 [Candidatus Magasanikbacteria bacterium CG_4_10_14_0_2_um_filter_33_14]
MRQEIDKIKIKEPPIEELSKQRSCVKSTCATGCGCFTILFVISIVLLKFAFGPTSKELKDLPETFTTKIPIYDVSDIETITHTSGKEKSKKIERAAYIPKLVLSPFIIYFDKDYKYIPRENSNVDLNNIEKFWSFMKKPLTTQKDIYKIEWLNLHAEQRFLIDYYETELKKKDFEISPESKNDEIIQFTFSDTKNDIDGVVFSSDDPNTNDTDYLSITVNFPSE